jgi:hypothetical protein
VEDPLAGEAEVDPFGPEGVAGPWTLVPAVPGGEVHLADARTAEDPQPALPPSGNIHPAVTVLSQQHVPHHRTL